MDWRLGLAAILVLAALSCARPADQREEHCSQGTREQTETGEEMVTTSCLDSEGRRHGVQTTEYPAGQLLARMRFEHGVLEGLSELFHENGVPATVTEYRKGWATRAWVRGEDGGLEDEWIRLDERGDQPIEGTGEGMGEGRWRRLKWWPNGTLRFDSEWQDGKPHGPFRTWHKSGALHAEGDFVHGEKVGEWRRWRDDGTPDAGRPDSPAALEH
jgi:antitoxin component YwqK of YwqJK toxin-antitoxin module